VTAAGAPFALWWEPFQAQARLIPDEAALVTADAVWTFRALEEWSNRLARLLRDRGLRPGSVVASALNRSALWVVAVLAIAKAGGVLLPLDPRSPAARLRSIRSDARPALVVADESWPLETDQVIALTPGCWRQVLEPYSPRPIDDHARGDGPAYLIYTSGSSGRPKGVLVGQRSLANVFDVVRTRLMPLARRSDAQRRLRVAHGIPLSFDAAWNPLLWMVGGHELHLLSEDRRRDPARYVEMVRGSRIDVVEAVPSVAEALLDAGLLEGEWRPSLLLMGGEAIPPGLWRRLRGLPSTKAVNLYGPTECTIFATCCELDEYPTPVIGQPVPGVRARVVNGSGDLVPDGQTGELLLGGECLALGYWEDPVRTARQFFDDPDEPGAGRWYRTGDRCRRLPGGALEFQGRIDDQVQIRGHRVEPGEVEQALLAQPGISRAVVVAAGEGADLHLLAYVVPGPDAGPDAGAAAGELSSRLSQRLLAVLPDHLIPRRIVALDALPIGPNGKVDRAALPAVPAPAGVPSRPRNAAELTVAAAWCEVLGLAAADIHADFFDAGGHSLLAARLAIRLRAAGLPCTLLDVMAHPTIAQLAAAVITQRDDTADPSPVRKES
jgi:amino acid adenylation domain-containing protein